MVRDSLEFPEILESQPFPLSLLSQNWSTFLHTTLRESPKLPIQWLQTPTDHDSWRNFITSKMPFFVSEGSVTYANKSPEGLNAIW